MFGSLWGPPDRKSPFARTRPRSYKSQARLQLRHGPRSADPDPRSSEMAGSDPQSEGLVRARGGARVHTPGPAPSGVAPFHQSLRERLFAAEPVPKRLRSGGG